MLYVSSPVIVFHRRRKKCKVEKGKSKGKSMENAPHPRGGRGHRHANGKPHARKNGRNGTKQAKKKLYYAELRASCL